jgi:hypothetical protein
MDKEQNIQKKLDQVQEKYMEKEWLEKKEIEEEKKEMQEENDINKRIIKVKINRYPNTISGVYLYENEEFVVMLNNPVDYVIDGIYFINKNYIKNIETDQDIISNKILLHKASLYNTDNMNFSNLKKILQHLLNKQQLIEFYLDKQSYTLIGRIISIDNEVIKVNLVDTQSSFLKKEKISYNKIRVLAINTDYVDALEWYSKHKE